MRFWLAGLGLAVLVAGAVVATRDDGPSIEVPDRTTGALVTAPSAPTGPLIFRWAATVDDERALVGVAVVDDTVVMATRAPLLDGQRNALEVTGLDMLDGGRRWVRNFDDPGAAVLVGDGDELALLASQPRGDGAVRPDVIVDQRVVLALDGDGGTRWNHHLAGATAIRFDRPRGRVLVSDAAGVRELSASSGAVMRSVGGDGNGGGSPPHRATDAWIVHAAQGWQVWPDDGSSAIAVGPSVVPAVTSDLVVTSELRTTAEESRIVARTRTDGEIAWELEVPGVVAQLSTVEAPGTRPVAGQSFPLPTRQAGAVEAVVWPVADTSGDTQFWVLDDAGGLVTTDRAPSHSDERNLTLRVDLDGRPWSLCHASAWQWPPSNCPNDVALADADGRVVGRIDDLVGIGRATQTWSRVTTEGVIVQDGDAVELRRWPDLAVLWTLPDGVADHLANDLHLDMTSRGIAIGTEAVTDSVAWYE